MRARVLVVVAHPDDESFGTGSVLAWAAAAGADTFVCCATRGEAGERVDGGDEPLAVVRERELREAARVLGVTDVVCLGYRDSGMAGPPAATTLAGAPWDDVVRAVTAVVDDIRPDVVVTLDASDGHRDHARIRDAAIEASRLASEPPRAVYLSCLPRSLMRRWIEHAQANQPGREHLTQELATLGTPDAEVTTVLDVRDHLATRRRAMRAHASQTSPFDVLPPELQDEWLATDHLRRVVPPWDGGPVERSLSGLGVSLPR